MTFRKSCKSLAVAITEKDMCPLNAILVRIDSIIELTYVLDRSKH